MALELHSDSLRVKPFVWENWSALWHIRSHQLAEDGIHLDVQTIPPTPRAVDPGDPEWDLHHMATIYLSGAGHFWLAWDVVNPIGYVGAHDVGGALELRRLYVQHTYRRHGVGRQLMQTVLEHGRKHRVRAIELMILPHLLRTDRIIVLPNKGIRLAWLVAILVRAGVLLLIPLGEPITSLLRAGDAQAVMRITVRG